MPMNLTDPIADMLTRIRNANTLKRETVFMPHSKIKLQILQLMLEEGFIRSVSSEEQGGHPVLKVQLRYYDGNDGAIHGLKRVSTPGLRIYVGKDDIPDYYSGLGMAFISTSKGIMSSHRARKQNVGGELLFYVW